MRGEPVPALSCAASAVGQFINSLIHSAKLPSAYKRRGHVQIQTRKSKSEFRFATYSYMSLGESFPLSEPPKVFWGKHHQIR